MAIRYNNNRFKFIGDIVEKQTSKINQAMIKDGRFKGFITAEPVSYLMQWNTTAKTRYYMPIRKSFNMAISKQYRLFEASKKKFIDKGYKPVGKIFHSC